jgi:hypothetical protein
MDEQITKVDIKSVTTNLYRIAPDVKQEIKKALECYVRLPINVNRILVTRAMNDLMNPIDVNAPPEVTPLPVPLNIPSGTIQEANLKNSLEALKQAITIEKNNTENQETKEALNKVLQRVPDFL